MSKVIYCPVNGWDCPYFDANGCCMMYPDTDPIKECDDFAMFWEEGENYICDTDKIERCEHCDHFIEGDHGEWICTVLKQDIEEIEECPDDYDYEPDVDETFYDPYMGCDFYE